MKEFYYSDARKDTQAKMEGYGTLTKIRHMDNLALSMSMDVEGTMDAVKKIITQRIELAKMAYFEDNMSKKEQLHCVIDCTNDDLRKLLAL